MHDGSEGIKGLPCCEYCDHRFSFELPVFTESSGGSFTDFRDFSFLRVYSREHSPYPRVQIQRNLDITFLSNLLDLRGGQRLYLLLPLCSKSDLVVKSVTEKIRDVSYLESLVSQRRRHFSPRPLVMYGGRRDPSLFQ